jgi:hypothetical protein
MLEIMTGETGAGEVTTDSVRLYVMTEDAMLEPLWSAEVVLLLCWIATVALFHYWWGWPGVTGAAVISFFLAALVYWGSCKGPRSMEVSDARLRLVDHRGRVCGQYERAEVRNLEFERSELLINLPAWRHRYAINLYHVAPGRVLRLRTALERHGWLQPDGGGQASGEGDQGRRVRGQR